MGAINYGNQTIAFDYNQAGKAETFNKINYELFPIGIYNGGLLTYVNTTTIQVATFNSFIEDSANKLGVSLKTEDVVNISVAPSTPYIVIQFSWDNSDNNYADIVAIDYASINADDLIIGKCAYNTSNVLQTTFDYTRRTVSSLQNLDNQKNNLKVIAEEPYANTVYVNSGELIIDGTYIEYSAGSSPTFSNTTLGRIDLVYINEAGTLSVLEGVDDASPSAPDFLMSIIVLAKITRGASATVVRGDQIENYLIDRESIDTASILAKTTVYNITTASNEVHALPDATTVENQHIVKRRGDGNGIVTFTTEDSQTIDIESPTELTLEGEASIILIPKDGNWESVKTGGAVSQVSGELADTTAIRNLVYFDTNGTLSIGDKGELSKAILAGFLTKAGVATDIRFVQSSGILEGFTGLVEGTQYFLGDAGGVVVKGAINYEDYIVSVGVAVSTTEMDVSIRLPEPTRNQDDSINVGNAIPVFGTTDAEGYLYADARPISRVNYSVLFGVIGTTFGVGDGSTTFNIPAQADYTALGDAALKWHIKAEHVTSAGEPISALRDSQDWVEFTGDWRNKEFVVTPAASIGYSSVDDIYDLQVEIWLADDDTPTNPVLMIALDRIFDSSSATDIQRLYGLSIMPNDSSSFLLQTGEHGVQYMSPTGTLVSLSTTETGAYKVIITKPNLVNTVFDVSSMPKTYDLTSANVEVALPARSGVLQTRDIFWENGGTYKLTIREHADDGGALLDYEGEGEGHISLTAGSSAWLVKEYEDSGKVGTYGYWKKELNGTLIQRDLVVVPTISAAYVTSFIWTYPYDILSTIDRVITAKQQGSHGDSNFGNSASAASGARTLTYQEMDVISGRPTVNWGSVADLTFGLTCIDRWKT